tara:strand:+ start:238 stop:510 length:273 start_codon:yes stop_codon:yes gene_type:complete
MKSIIPPIHKKRDNYTFELNGDLFYGSCQEIIVQMKHIEWGETPSAIEWKDRVVKRAEIFGQTIEFTDAYSFLCGVERVGLGRFCVIENI